MLRSILVLLTAFSTAFVSAGASAQCMGRWLPSDSSMAFDNEVNRLAPWGDRLVATGRFTHIGPVTAPGIAYWNGAAWQPLPSPGTGTIYAALEFEGALYIAINSTVRRLAAPDGAWETVATTFNSSVLTLCVYQGSLFAAGNFTQTGSVTRAHIARLTPTGWANVGSGIDGRVEALAVFNGNLIAGGALSQAGGVPGTSQVAQWNGATWSAVGIPDLPSRPLRMYVDRGSLLVAGYASMQSYLIQWDGAEWMGLVYVNLSEMAGISRYNGTLFVGSAATLITSVGDTFERSGPIFASPAYTTVFTMANYRGMLFVGGYFTTVLGEPSPMLARWYQPTADFDNDGDTGTDQDIEAFFACLSGNCCATCGMADFDADGDAGTDADIEAFFRALAGGTC